MELSIKFPVMARALGKGFRGERRLFVSHEHRQDVPEVTLRETSIAVPTTVLKDARGQIGAVRELRLHDDRLYRYLGSAADLTRVRSSLLDVSFSYSPHGAADYVHTSNPDFNRLANLNPLSRPVFSVFMDRLDAINATASSRNKTWPEVRAFNGMGENSATSLSVIEKELLWVSQEDLEESFSMHQRQAERLLLIDGGLWYETKPPCIAVDTQWTAHTHTESSVEVSYRYMQDVMDQTPTRMYFPLEAVDRALDVAEQMKKRFRMKGVISNLPRIETSDHDSFKFDMSEDLVTRTAQALSMSLLKYAVQRPDKMVDVDAGWLAGVSEMFHAHNPILGKEVDFPSILPSLIETYLRLSPYKFGGISRMQNVQLRKVLPQVLETLDDMPISVHGLAATPAFSVG
jgi:hypothetical protein